MSRNHLEPQPPGASSSFVFSGAAAGAVAAVDGTVGRRWRFSLRSLFGLLRSRPQRWWIQEMRGWYPLVICYIAIENGHL